jgi:hypothetical protein
MMLLMRFLASSSPALAPEGVPNPSTKANATLISGADVLDYKISMDSRWTVYSI